MVVFRWTKSGQVAHWRIPEGLAVIGLRLDVVRSAEKRSLPNKTARKKRLAGRDTWVAEVQTSAINAPGALLAVVAAMR
jgi:hypothetical protein